MKPTAKFFVHNDQFWFDVVDMDDTTTVGDDVLPELLFTSSKGYTREGSAERAADTAIEKFNRATEAERRRLCGYDPVSKCLPRKDRPTRGRVGNRNTPARAK